MQVCRPAASLGAFLSALAVACTAPAATHSVSEDAAPVAESVVARPQEPASKKPIWTQEELEAMSREIQAQVAEIREAEFERPVTVRLANERQFFEYAMKRQEKTETPEKIAGDETIAKLLGVFPPDLDLMETAMAFLKDQVGGFYDPSDDSFSLMDQCPKGVAKIVLAHELGHALDDQLYSIDSRLDELLTNTDAALAYHAVVEGSGTSVMTLWIMRNVSELGGSLAEMGEMQEKSNESMAKAPMWLWKPLIAVYLQGASFLARSSNVMAGQMGGAKNQDIDAAFAKPPRSMEQVLHPEKYWDDAKRDEPVSVAFDASKVGDGWELLRDDTLGEFLLAILATPAEERRNPDFSNPMSIMGLQFTNAAGRGWDGDRVALLGRGEARYLRLVTRWDSAGDATEFHDALAANLDGLRAAAKALAERSGAESDAERTSGADLARGVDDVEVVLSVWSRVSESERARIGARLAVKIGGN